MEFSSNLFKILLGAEQSPIEGALVNPILQIIKSVLRISQKRKIYQPHYTLSTEGLFHVYQAVHRLDCAGLGPNSAGGLKVILMNMPQITLLRMVSLSLSLFLFKKKKLLSLCFIVHPNFVFFESWSKRFLLLQEGGNWLRLEDNFVILLKFVGLLCYFVFGSC